MGGPILVVVLVVFIYHFVSTLQDHDAIRYLSVKQASIFLSENPLLGFGKDNVTLLESEVMHSRFYSSDIGLLGAAFRVGILGALFMLYMLIYTLTRAITVNWMLIKNYGKGSVFIFFFIFQATGDLVNIALSAVQYLKLVGLLSIAATIGLTAVYRHSLVQKIMLQKKI